MSSGNFSSRCLYWKWPVQFLTSRFEILEQMFSANFASFLSHVFVATGTPYRKLSFISAGKIFNTKRNGEKDCQLIVWQKWSKNAMPCPGMQGWKADVLFLTRNRQIFENPIYLVAFVQYYQKNWKSSRWRATRMSRQSVKKRYESTGESKLIWSNRITDTEKT